MRLTGITVIVKKIYNQKIYIFRPIGEYICNEESTGNVTRLVPGKYEKRSTGVGGIVSF